MPLCTLGRQRDRDKKYAQSWIRSAMSHSNHNSLSVQITEVSKEKKEKDNAWNYSYHVKWVRNHLQRNCSSYKKRCGAPVYIKYSVFFKVSVFNGWRPSWVCLISCLHSHYFCYLLYIIPQYPFFYCFIHPICKTTIQFFFVFFLHCFHTWTLRRKFRQCGWRFFLLFFF